MLRMQLLGLGLVLMLSWAGWASSATVDRNKLEGKWKHVYTASNDLQKYRDQEFLRLLGPNFECYGTCKYSRFRALYRYEGECRFLARDVRFRRGGILQIFVPPGNFLQVLDVTNSMLLLGYIDQNSKGDTYDAVLALGRRDELSDADTKKFQDVLKQKGIVAEPMHFTDIVSGEYFCRPGKV